MRAVEDPDPAPNPEHDEHFQGSPSWGSAPRIDAAQALMALARRSAEMAASLQPAILHLAADPVATVRFQIARHLTYLFRAAPELMWQLLERFGKEEGNRGVLQGTLDVLQQIANVDPPRIARLALDIFDRMPPEGAGVSHVRDQCSNIFAGLTIWHKEPISIATIERMIASPVDFHRDVRRVIFDLSAWIKNDDQEICKIAFALMDRVLDAQLVGMRAIEAQFEGSLFVIGLRRTGSTTGNS